MVLASVAATSFSILLLLSLPSCLHLRANPFSAEGVGASASSLYSSDTDSRSGYCTSTRTFDNMCAPLFSASSNVPFIFPVFALFFLPNLLPSPTIVAAIRPTLIDVGTGESILLRAFLCACHQGGHYRCTFVLCLIGRPKAHNFWHGPYLARPNLIVGLGRHGPHCGPCLGLKSSTRAGLARPI
jgi:hypothetical protein